MPKGDKGDTGLQGPTGAQGPKGATGDTGPAGADGKNGADGKDGKDGADGADGADGRGITSITKTGTSGLVDTYTITYTDNTTSTYTVTNGANGTSGSDEIYSRTETLTNKKYVDENNTTHPVYRKIVTFPQGTTIADVTINDVIFKGIAHGITNFSRIIDCYMITAFGSLSAKAEIASYISFNGQYIISSQTENLNAFISTSDYDVEVVMEYTKS